MFWRPIPREKAKRAHSNCMQSCVSYWLKNIVDGIALTVSIVFCAYLNSRLPIANGYLKFVCSGILCEAVSVALFGVFHFGDPEVRKMLKYLVNHSGKR